MVLSGQAGNQAAGTVNVVAYVSLAPGSVTPGTEIVIRNVRLGTTVQVVATDGGFDPIEVPAVAGDTLSAIFRVAAQADVETIVVVPSRRPPIIVRTNPPPKKRDVPLAERILVVFSEPVDEASITPATVTLLGNGAPVPGSPHVDANAPWIVEFLRDQELAPGVDHELTVSGVRDLDGDIQDSAFTATFTTGQVSPDLPGRLVFATPGTEPLVYTVTPNGADYRKLDAGFSPKGSPDGSRIVYSCKDDSDIWGICVMNSDGSNIVRLTEDGYEPAWSPDGNRIVFGCGAICVMNADGTGRRFLTQSDDLGLNGVDCQEDSEIPAPPTITPSFRPHAHHEREGAPSWSSKGTIAFMRWPPVHPVHCSDFIAEIWLIEADGTRERPLHRDGNVFMGAGWPSWSPDGSLLAFFLTTGPFQAIVAMSEDASTFRYVVRTDDRLLDAFLGAPAWSPNGKFIVWGTTTHWFFAPTDLSQVLTTGVLTSIGWGTIWSWSAGQ